jgi:16S rRNA (guanine966-N2)-methyltransferase
MSRPGMIRIIAGQWRGRKLIVPDVKDLRPTPDRVRETLFNWLNPYIPNAYCLDLFAGSGALGVESLSRGAAHVTLVDQSTEAIRLLQKQLQAWGASNATVYRAQLPEQLQRSSHRFDIVFLDPPYQANLLLPCCFYLEEQDFLSDISYIYLEAKKTISNNELPSNWKLLKIKQAGQVYYHLAKRVKQHE